MNNKDKIIFDFFRSAEIINSKNNEKIKELIIRKEYSDINIQDEYGNTFLHYSFKYNKDIIVQILLASKADVSIFNNQQKIPSHMADEDFNLYDYYVNAKEFKFNYDFSQLTKKFHPSYKQFIYELSSEAAHNYFTNPDQLKKLLKDSEIYTDQNFLYMLAASKNIDNRLAYYLENYNSPSNNSFFLEKLFGVGGGLKDEEKKLLPEITNRQFNNDKFFTYLFRNLLFNFSKKEYEEFIKKLIEITVEQKFDLTPFYGNIDTSLKDTFNRYPVLQNLYDKMNSSYEIKKTLEHDLTENSKNKVKKKI